MRLIVWRIIGAIPLVLTVVIITFVLARLAPGDPINAMIETGADTSRVDAIKHEYGLDLPIYQQLWLYLVQLAHGNLGYSFSQGGIPVSEIIGDSWLVSLQLGSLAVLIMVVLGVPLGVLAAVHRRRKLDLVIRGFMVLGTSIPSFVLAYAAIWTLGVQWKLVPIVGWGTPEQAILPAFFLALPGAALLCRQTRSAVLDALSQDYVRTARAKGMAEWIVLTRHALRNGLLPVVTLLGPVMGAAVGGFFIMESIFSIPGMGRLSVQAIFSRDYPLLQGIVLLLSLAFIIINLAVDLTYLWIDPRIHYRRARRRH
jgi:ABC-type dipeptide/oligopeptide/nickel transport system permease component